MLEEVFGVTEDSASSWFAVTPGTCARWEAASVTRSVCASSAWVASYRAWTSGFDEPGPAGADGSVLINTCALAAYRGCCLAETPAATAAVISITVRMIHFRR